MKNIEKLLIYLDGYCDGRQKCDGCPFNYICEILDCAINDTPEKVITWLDSTVDNTGDSED